MTAGDEADCWHVLSLCDGVRRTAQNGAAIASASLRIATMGSQSQSASSCSTTLTVTPLARRHTQAAPQPHTTHTQVVVDLRLALLPPAPRLHRMVAELVLVCPRVPSCVLVCHGWQQPTVGRWEAAFALLPAVRLAALARGARAVPVQPQRLHSTAPCTRTQHQLGSGPRSLHLPPHSQSLRCTHSCPPAPLSHVVSSLRNCFLTADENSEKAVLSKCVIVNSSRVLSKSLLLVAL